MPYIGTIKPADGKSSWGIERTKSGYWKKDILFKTKLPSTCKYMRNLILNKDDFAELEKILRNAGASKDWPSLGTEFLSDSIGADLYKLVCTTLPTTLKTNCKATIHGFINDGSYEDSDHPPLQLAIHWHPAKGDMTPRPITCGFDLHIHLDFSDKVEQLKMFAGKKVADSLIKKPPIKRLEQILMAEFFNFKISYEQYAAELVKLDIDNIDEFNKSFTLFTYKKGREHYIEETYGPARLYYPRHYVASPLPPAAGAGAMPLPAPAAAASPGTALKLTTPGISYKMAATAPSGPLTFFPSPKPTSAAATPTPSMSGTGAIRGGMGRGTSRGGIHRGTGRGAYRGGRGGMGMGK